MPQHRMTAIGFCNAPRDTAIPSAGMKGLAALQKHYRVIPYGRKPRRAIPGEMNGFVTATVGVDCGGAKA